MNENKIIAKKFVMEVMVKPLPKVLLKCALVYEATVAVTVVVLSGIAYVISKRQKQ